MKTVPTEEQAQALNQKVEALIVDVVEGFTRDPAFKDLTPQSVVVGLANNMMQAVCLISIEVGLSVDQLHRFLDKAFSDAQGDVRAINDALRDIAGRN